MCFSESGPLPRGRPQSNSKYGPRGPPGYYPVTRSHPHRPTNQTRCLLPPNVSRKANRPPSGHTEGHYPILQPVSRPPRSRNSGIIMQPVHTPYRVPQLNPQRRPSTLATLSVPMPMGRPLIRDVSHLRFPNRNQATALLLNVVALVKPIMIRWNLIVRPLSEFWPDDPRLLGENMFFGDKIRIRLREGSDANKLLPMEEVVDIVLHELYHNVFSDHNEYFNTMWLRLRQEYEEIHARARRNSGLRRIEKSRPRRACWAGGQSGGQSGGHGAGDLNGPTAMPATAHIPPLSNCGSKQAGKIRVPLSRLGHFNVN